MKRKTDKEVRAYLSNFGLELLSNYVNIRTEFKLKHKECGHIFRRTLNHIYKNPKCPKCYPPKTARRNIDQVNKIISKNEGHILISNEYENQYTPLKIKCEITDESVTTYLKFFRKYGCKACNQKRVADNLREFKKKKLEEIKTELAKEGYKLTSKTYEDNKKDLSFICPEGHKGSIRWNNWINGARCFDCKYENFIGEGNPRWLGGVTDRNLVSYDTAFQYLEKVEQIRRDPIEPQILQVKCNFCGEWFSPTRTAFHGRVDALKTADLAEVRLYCSDDCKSSCPVYRKRYIKCAICGKDFIGKGGIKYCDNCTPSRTTFSNKQKESIFQRDIELGWVNKNSRYQVHHILNVADFPEYAKEDWNGWALDSEYHDIIHNVCGLGNKDLYGVDERYWEIAINKLKENKAPKEIIKFCIRLYEDVTDWNNESKIKC